MRASLAEFFNHNLAFAKATDGSYRPYSLIKLGPVFAYSLWHRQLRLSASPGLAYATQTAAYTTGFAVKGYAVFEAEYLPARLPDFSLFAQLGATQTTVADRYALGLAYDGGVDWTLGVRHYF